MVGLEPRSFGKWDQCSKQWTKGDLYIPHCVLTVLIYKSTIIKCLVIIQTLARWQHLTDNISWKLDSGIIIVSFKFKFWVDVPKPNVLHESFIFTVINCQPSNQTNFDFANCRSLSAFICLSVSLCVVYRSQFCLHRLQIFTGVAHREF